MGAGRWELGDGRWEMGVEKIVEGGGVVPHGEGLPDRVRWLQR